MSSNVKYVNREREETTVADRTYVSWGAVLAGLVVTVALIWLLTLLGTAIGVSVVDSTNTESLAEGLGLGAVIWMILTGLISFFIGSLVAGRLCGQDESQEGMLHGLTMWSSAAVICLVLSAWGVSGLVTAGSALVSNASSAVAQSSPGLSQWANGQNDSADPAVQRTEVTGIAAAVKNEVAQALEKESEGEVSQQDAKDAMNQLSPEAMRQIGAYILVGDMQAAKDTLTLHTNLNADQVDTIANNVSTEVEEQVATYQQDLKQATDEAQAYAQGVLWTSAITVMLGLLVSIAGGMLGCHAAVKIHTVATEKRRITTKAA